MKRIRDILKSRNNRIVIILFLLALIIFFILIIVKDLKYSKSSTYTFALVGDTELEIEQGTPYKEMGFIASDGINDLSYDVITYGKVDSDKEGIYFLYYSLYDESIEKNITLHRQVTVLKGDLLVENSVYPTSYTSGFVNIKINVSSNFSYAILPDNSKTKDSSFSYKVDKNGTYKFKIYSVDNKEYIKNIEINNIDREAPKGLCLVNDNQAYVIADDTGSGIKKYIFSSNNKVVYEGEKNTTEIKTIKNAKVFVYDNVGNKIYMECYESDTPLNGEISTNTNIKIYRYGKYNYIIPKTKNDLTKFAEKTKKDVRQTYSSEGADMCLNVARYYCRCINDCEIDKMNAKEAYKVIRADEFYYPYYQSLKPMFQKIYDEIMNGRPLILQVGASSMTSRHYVMLVGFKTTVTSVDKLQESDLLIIDTYDGVLKAMDRSNYDGENFRQIYYDKVRNNAGYRLGYFK